ncbi:MAG: ATP-binding cassette domain-containing protein [Candidatus Eisenbacteria bacterium]|nr:ATP-binding cassette domain-containing protein [Candidatus Eisenbacteria bacterium]
MQTTKSDSATPRTTSGNGTIVRAEGLRKIYETPAETIAAVDGVDLTIPRGDFISLLGPSGSGKTTLLDLIGCLDSISEGHLEVFGTDVSDAKESELVSLRRGRIGFVFQEFLLLPELTALENVQVPSMFARSSIDRETAVWFLERVGLGKRADHLPSELSGGERQRVAIARALTTTSGLLLADEPTGNLDSKNSEAVYEVFRALNEEDGLTVVLATHDEHLGGMADRTIRLTDGRVEAVQ